MPIVVIDCDASYLSPLTCRKTKDRRIRGELWLLDRDRLFGSCCRVSVHGRPQALGQTWILETEVILRQRRGRSFRRSIAGMEAVELKSVFDSCGQSPP